uniref:Secretory carrier-associated membrane protein n=1 Tax=Calidris pygmaea TaxID=425635 RepID=A0A8C3PNQ7_9CHAR
MAPPQAAAQPPRKASPTEPRNYGSYGTQASAAAATAELLKRQEELNRKAEELDRRERELQNAALGGTARLNNWPPLPSFCPVKPCFYQDIPMEIPADFQKTVSTMYYLWMASTIALFLNFLSSLAWFCVDPSFGSGFGLSILWALLYTPCSFVCWYRPMYKAFRSDSSFNFFVFFFVFFAQNVMYVLQAIGIPNWGFSGWILSLIALRKNTAVAVMMILVSVFFTAVAVLGIIMLKRVSLDGTSGPECAFGRRRLGGLAGVGAQLRSLGTQNRSGALTLSLLFSSRSTLCTAGRAPASRKRRRSLLLGSSPTRRCAPPRPTLLRAPPPTPSVRPSQAGPGSSPHVGLF